MGLSTYVHTFYIGGSLKHSIDLLLVRPLFRNLDPNVAHETKISLVVNNKQKHFTL